MDVDRGLRPLKISGRSAINAAFCGWHICRTNTRYRVYDPGDGWWRKVCGPHACGPYRPRCTTGAPATSNTSPFTRGSIRKQSRKTLPAKRHLLRYRVLHSTKECCDPLPCICRFAAILRCYAVLAEPLFSYVTRALPRFFQTVARRATPQFFIFIF